MGVVLLIVGVIALLWLAEWFFCDKLPALQARRDRHRNWPAARATYDSGKRGYEQEEEE